MFITSEQKCIVLTNKHQQHTILKVLKTYLNTPTSLLFSKWVLITPAILIEIVEFGLFLMVTFEFLARFLIDNSQSL